ncbi:hypothetical protein J2S74_002838 [Evansella vedderi]|uniref:Uncharacterized protein n=1 Tax=Evansella vedderi TaxID=38282 RepID=A0ABT9ZW59_9BACI|nr:hypothetical protein [Evansella vedderi]MDQ0255456.1 hypothetical protein [Evansella vedderi]
MKVINYNHFRELLEGVESHLKNEKADKRVIQTTILTLSQFSVWFEMNKNMRFSKEHITLENIYEYQRHLMDIMPSGFEKKILKQISALHNILSYLQDRRFQKVADFKYVAKQSPSFQTV